MPSGETNGLTSCHTRSRVRGRVKTFHGDRGTRGSEVPLLHTVTWTPATRVSAPKQGRRFISTNRLSMRCPVR